MTSPTRCGWWKKLLEEHEATVATAGTVAEAFDALSLDEPDVLISDIGMPDEDGYSLIRKVRRHQSGSGLLAGRGLDRLRQRRGPAARARPATIYTWPSRSIRRNWSRLSPDW